MVRLYAFACCLDLETFNSVTFQVGVESVSLLPFHGYTLAIVSLPEDCYQDSWISLETDWKFNDCDFIRIGSLFRDCPQFADVVNRCFGERDHTRAFEFYDHAKLFDFIRREVPVA